jgi:hypothetical protein
MGSNKKRRIDELNQIDNSIQSLVMDFKAKSDRSMDDLCDFMGTFMEKSEEFRRTVYQIQGQYCELESRVTSIEDKMASNHQEQSDRIESVEEGVTNVKKEAQESEGILHKIEQARYDQHVFIAGFPEEPDNNEVVGTLTRLYNIPRNSIDFNYSFKFNLKSRTQEVSHSSNQQSKVIHQMVIGFKDHQSKMNFMKAKQEMGPLEYGQLTTRQLTKENGEATIRFGHRLTKFNLKAQKELHAAKVYGNLHAYQLHNGVFRIKEKEDSRWKQIETYNRLQPYIIPLQERTVFAASKPQNK